LCGNNEDCPARLKAYEDVKSANKNDSMIWEILFTDIEDVCLTERQQKKVITIGMQKGNKSLSFYADSHGSTIQWFRLCGLLSKIPKYAIPRIPKDNVTLQQNIDQYNDSHKYYTGS